MQVCTCIPESYKIIDGMHVHTIYVHHHLGIRYARAYLKQIKLNLSVQNIIDGVHVGAYHHLYLPLLVCTSCMHTQCIWCTYVHNILLRKYPDTRIHLIPRAPFQFKVSYRADSCIKPWGRLGRITCQLAYLTPTNNSSTRCLHSDWDTPLSRGPIR